MSIDSGPMREPDTPDAWPLSLFAALAAIWLLLALAPSYRADWLLENALVFAALPALWWGYGRLRFSRLAYAGLFVFLALHLLGAHYTYSEVPYDAWSRQWLGVSIDAALGFERNHYDRLVHFVFGLALAPLAHEWVNLRVGATRAWRHVIAVSFLLSVAAIYELLEWCAALVFGGELGMAYLGAQGDVWDGHKDTALALGGALLASFAIGLGRPALAARSMGR